MRTYGCRGCSTRFGVEKSGPEHTTHAAFCPFCGSPSINDLGSKHAAATFAEAQQRTRGPRQLTGRDL